MSQNRNQNGANANGINANQPISRELTPAEKNNQNYNKFVRATNCMNLYYNL